MLSITDFFREQSDVGKQFLEFALQGLSPQMSTLERYALVLELSNSFVAGFVDSIPPLQEWCNVVAEAEEAYLPEHSVSPVTESFFDTVGRLHGRGSCLQRAVSTFES